MKKLISLSILLTMLVFAAQAQVLRGLDKSPRDVAYFPDNFPHDRKDGDKALVRVLYSRPFMSGRRVFGELVPYGKVWRVGADEATEIKFYEDATIGDKQVKAGTYALFAIPNEKEWTIILSSDLDYWGAYKYKEANDVLRVSVPALNNRNEGFENFVIQFTGNKSSDVKMVMGWDKTIVEVPIHF